MALAVHGTLGGTTAIPYPVALKNEALPIRNQDFRQ